MKKILILALAIFYAIGMVPNVVAGGGPDRYNGNGIKFDVAMPDSIWILPGETFLGQFAIKSVDPKAEITAVKAVTFNNSLASNFYLDDQESHFQFTWTYDGLSSLADAGPVYTSNNIDGVDSFAWYSNSERGFSGELNLFAIYFTNVSPVGTKADFNVFVNAVFNNKSIYSLNNFSNFISIDGRRGDVDGTNEITQQDVDLLATYTPTWPREERRETGLNYGRGGVLFSEPDMISTWLINVYLHDPSNPILEGLGIGKMMSETAYVHTGVDAVTSATSVGKVAKKSTITRNVPFTSSAIGNSLTVSTVGDVVNVSALLPSGKRWQDTKWTTGGEAQFTIPDSNAKYRIDVVKLPGREITTAVEETVPRQFSLGQNYPNPFNPSTTIPFNISKSGKVRVDIFNVAGQKVDTLVNGQMSAGQHNVVWNAVGEATGIYVVRVQSGEQTVTRQMLFMK